MALTQEQHKAAQLRMAEIKESVEQLDRLPAAIDKASKSERFKARSKLMQERVALMGLLGEDDECIGGSPSQN
jgi:hypothetical protein